MGTPQSAIRNPQCRRVAAIDIGTNTVRLLVAEADAARGFRPLHQAQAITRLGEGLLPDRRLKPEPMRRTAAVLAEYAAAARASGAAAIAAVATAAAREATNAAAFLDQAGRASGLAIRVIGGEEEARLTLLGIRHALGLTHETILMLDIGGGSTEVALTSGPRPTRTISTGLGVVKLTERFLGADPPPAAALAAAAASVRERLARLPDELGHLAPAPLVGTAGTITSLAAIDLGLATYDPARITGHRLTRAKVVALCARLADLPLRDRRTLPGLEPARADVIVAGALILAAAMDALGAAECLVSDGGLREGLLLDLLASLEPARWRTAP